MGSVFDTLPAALLFTQPSTASFAVKTFGRCEAFSLLTRSVFPYVIMERYILIVYIFREPQHNNWGYVRLQFAGNTDTKQLARWSGGIAMSAPQLSEAYGLWKMKLYILHAMRGVRITARGRDQDGSFQRRLELAGNRRTSCLWLKKSATEKR